MQKARSHPRLVRRRDQAPTACMRTVSGSISLAGRRAFHHSLPVLFTIGHEVVFSLGGWSPQIQPGFHVSRPTREPWFSVAVRFAYGTLTPYGPPFQARSATLGHLDYPEPRNPGGL